ncbi:MAG: NDP-sugar synthase [Nitrospinae bacterium]|nr:NDP-sugar synthase [Nitrospinota bacterium]
MNAMILAAGLGTRLLPHTLRIPKPLFPVLGKTLLQNAVETALKMNPRRIVINVHHLADMMAEWIASHDFGVETIVSREEAILGTAGGIKNAERWLAGDHFAVINSDIIADIDWVALAEFRRDSKAVAALALRKNPDPEKYGPLCVDDGGKVVRYVKTAGPGHTGKEKQFMFTGLSVLSPEIFAMIPPGRAVDISSEVYSPMTVKGEGLYGMEVTSSWVDVGTSADYFAVVMEALRADGGNAHKGTAPASSLISPPVYMEPGVEIGDSVSIGPSVAIHSGARIGTGATLRDCIVLPGSTVGQGDIVGGRIV